jgi:predicted DNA-binding transcriptional regulator AlpA
MSRTMTAERDDLGDMDAYSIPEFCRRHGFSQSFFFKLQATGSGPRVMRVGARSLISKEAAQAWRRQREAAAADPTA